MHAIMISNDHNVQFKMKTDIKEMIEEMQYRTAGVKILLSVLYLTKLHIKISKKFLSNTPLIHNGMKKMLSVVIRSRKFYTINQIHRVKLLMYENER